MQARTDGGAPGTDGQSAEGATLDSLVEGFEEPISEDVRHRHPGVGREDDSGAAAKPAVPQRRLVPGARDTRQKTYVLVAKAILEASRAIGATPSAGELVFGVRRLMREQAQRDREHPPSASAACVCDESACLPVVRVLLLSCVDRLWLLCAIPSPPARLVVVASRR